MIEVGPLVAAIADAIRLLSLPLFAYAAYSDVRTRRVSNRLWPPLVVLGLIALIVEGADAVDAPPSIWQEFFIVTALSVGLLVPLAYGFWYLGGFGGADAKAIMVLAVVFPTVPTIGLWSTDLPTVEPAAGVFSLTILTNAVLVGLLYPLALAVRNALAGEISLGMFFGRRIPVEETVSQPGRLAEAPDGDRIRGLDLDALRMYLRWRGVTLGELRADPDRYRTTRPDDPNPVGDGAVADGGTVEDPWAAAAFLDDVPHGAYGTTPAMLRDGLEVVTTRERVWYTPGIPFILLIAGGLLVALTYGDVVQTAMAAIGLG